MKLEVEELFPSSLVEKAKKSMKLAQISGWSLNMLM
jgi:hypothetical protein